MGTHSDGCPDPRPNLTVIGLFAESPPTELDLDVRTYGPICDTEPMPDGFCPNGTRACPPVFGDFGFGHLNALTSILGSNSGHCNTRAFSAAHCEVEQPDCKHWACRLIGGTAALRVARPLKQRW